MAMDPRDQEDEWAARRHEPIGMAPPGVTVPAMSSGPGGTVLAGPTKNVILGTNNGTIHQYYKPTFNHYTIVGHDDRDLLTLLNPILDASHTRNRKLSPPNSQCLPGTREQVISMVLSWADGGELRGEVTAKHTYTVRHNAHILWIYGYAGCGKSAISQKVAEELSKGGLLGASFFFFKGAGNRSGMGRLVNTIAHQLAVAVPALVPFIKSTVDKFPGILSTSTSALCHQFEQLIYIPILAVTDSLGGRTLIIVFDGIDECEDREDVASFIEHAIEFFSTNPLIPLRFVIASRVEDHLHRELHGSDQVHLLDLVKHTSDADIKAALEVSIEKNKRGRVLACAQSWPSEWEKQALVKHIGGSYIFMTTIIQLLFDPYNNDGLTPMDRLPVVLGTSPDFDGLYRTVLSSSSHHPHFQNIINTVALAKEALSVTQIADLLELRTVDIVNILINLHSIMQIPGDDRTPITLWHTSLRDYICSKDRAGPLWACSAHHLYLAYRSKALSITGAWWLRYSNWYAQDHLMESVAKGEDVFEGDISKMSNRLDDVVFDGQTALEAACWEKRWNVVRALVNANADVNTRFHSDKDDISIALHAACHFEDTNMVYFLLEKGADPNIAADKSFRAEKWGYCAFPLAWAAAKGHIELVNQLLACGADPNLKGGWYGSALNATGSSGTDEIMHILLGRGADPHVIDGVGWSLLHHACTKGHVKIVMTLLKFGTDPSIQSSLGSTPLHFACVGGHVRVADLLLNHGADPNAQDKGGNTPLHYTCSEGHVEVTELLLDCKADSSMRNKVGKTALQVAQLRKEDVVTMMNRRGIAEQVE